MRNAELIDPELFIPPAASRERFDNPLSQVLKQAEDTVRGDRGDSEEGKPREHVAQKAGADPAVVVTPSKVESRAGNQRQHEGLGDATGLDQSLRLAKGVVKQEGQAGIDNTEES